MTGHFLQVTLDLQEKYVIESTMPLVSDTVKSLATARSFIIDTVHIYLETGTELVTYYYHCEHT